MCIRNSIYWGSRGSIALQEAAALLMPLQISVSSTGHVVNFPSRARARHVIHSQASGLTLTCAVRITDHARFHAPCSSLPTRTVWLHWSTLWETLNHSHLQLWQASCYGAPDGGTFGLLWILLEGSKTTLGTCKWRMHLVPRHIWESYVFNVRIPYAVVARFPLIFPDGNSL